jgi:hypothetical protein
MARYHELRGLNNRNVMSDSSSCYMSKIKVSVELASLEDCKVEYVPCLTPSFWWCAGTLWHCLAQSLPSSSWNVLSVHVDVHISPLCDASHI